MPKERLIHLKPVKIYANGRLHSEQSLKKMITDIEGKKRKSGVKSKAGGVQWEVPPEWENYEESSESI